MILACQYCGGIEPFIISILAAIWCGIAYGAFCLTRWLRQPVKPMCQSCRLMVGCLMNGVQKCPLLKPRYQRLWRKA